MDVNFLLDKCKKVCGARTDAELAAALGVSKQALSSYRNGHRLPDPVQCATIAGLSGLPLAQVIGTVGEARAISREEKAVWHKLAATAIALIIIAGGPAMSLIANVNPLKMHIMSRARAVSARYYLGLLRLLLASILPAKSLPKGKGSIDACASI